MATAKVGLFLSPVTASDWIGTKGPFGLTGLTASVFETVMANAQALAADLEAMEFAKRVSRPRADLLHKGSGVIIEVDELQHFTSHQLGTLLSAAPEAGPASLRAR